MGQTLSNGVYLPNEGERNCYAGLASNWQILNTAVGNIAEKAPLVHTHGNITNDGKVGTTANLPLITGTGGAVQAGSFGNAANTFCEGNDSRLSDARTPVAHTHTKSDVTDLLNSNFIPSANNSYDLGSSSYQWNNLYAKDYYYNGVAWGLNKANVWSAWQTQEHATEPLIRLRRPNLQIGDPIPASQQIIGTIPFADKNNLNLGLIACRDNTNGDTFLTLIARQRYDSNGRANNGTQYESRIDLGIDSSQNLYLRPNSNGKIDLGTSTNKWKSLNGINPGALSLPDIYDSYDVVTTNWSTAYNQPNDLKINGADPSYPGWLFIRLDNCTAANDFVIVRYFHVNATNLTFFGSFIPTASSYVLSVPIQAGITTKVWVSKIPTTCKYYACLGTVK